MGRTSIPVNEDTRELLDDLRGDEYRNWDAFLKACAAAYKRKGFATVHEVGSDDIVDVFEDPGLPEPNVDFPTADVKEAVREVLREELSEGALR